MSGDVAGVPVGTRIPTQIFILWLQGERYAPPLVQMCIARWRRLNPGYEVRVLDRSDVRRILRGFPQPMRRIPPQALSDIVRITLLREHGGVWADATTLPITPLDRWLPDAASSGFFAFQGHREPIDVDSWFLAAAPHNRIAESWSDSVMQYWQSPRKLLEFPPDRWGANYELDPESFFRPGVSEHTDRFPYFWFMFLFTHLRSTDPVFDEAWRAVEPRSGAAAHSVALWTERDASVSDDDLLSAALSTDIQKLSFKARGVERWLRLDAALADHDRSMGVECSDDAPFVPGPVRQAPLERVRAAFPLPVRTAVRRALERL